MNDQMKDAGLSSADAIKILEEKVAAIANLSVLPYDAQEFKQWRRDTRVALLKIFAGDNGSHAGEFGRISYSPAVFTVGGDDGPFYRAHRAGLTSAEAKLKSMIREIQDWGLPTNHVADSSSLLFLPTVFRRFHGLARQLRKRHDGRPTLEIDDEHDVQDFLHVLLRLYFDDIRPEEWVPSYAGSGSRMDFLLKKEQTVIEAKKTRKSLADKEVGEQLIVDIQKYRSHPDCKSLICFVYDPEGKIANPKALETDLSRADDGFAVTVLVEPK